MQLRILPFYSFTLLLFYSFTLLLFYFFTLLLFYSFTLLLFNFFTLLLFYFFTFLLLKPFPSQCAPTDCLHQSSAIPLRSRQASAGVARRREAGV